MKVFLAAMTVFLISIGLELKTDAQVVYPSTESPPLTLSGSGVSSTPPVLTPYPLTQPLIQSPFNQLGSQQDLWFQNQQLQRQQINQNLQQQNQQQLREAEQQQQMMLRHHL